MPTLLQINSNANVGSTGVIAEQLGVLAIHNGWESYIAYGRDCARSKSHLIKIGNNIEVYFHVLLTRLFDWHCFGSKRATRKFIRDIERIKPDVVHLHNLHGYYLNIELLFAYLSKNEIPIIWTFHDCWPITGHCCYFSLTHCVKWQCECSRCPQKKSYPQVFLLDNSRQNYRKKKHIFQAVDNLTIVPVSQWLGDLIFQSFLSKKQIQVIYNGVDIVKFMRNDYSLFRQEQDIENKFIITGVASRWTHFNGLGEFIALSKCLAKDEVIVLVGLTRKQIDQLPCNIIGIELLADAAKLVDIYSVSNLFINASKEVTFGLTTVEAMACGVPAVVFDNTPGDEIIDNKTGYVINNIQEVPEIINHVKAMGMAFYADKCRERAVALFDKDKCFANYIGLYNSCLNQ